MKRYTAGEALEAIFNDEDSLDEQFDCGSDVEIVPDSAENENDSDLDAQITQIISNLELQDQEALAMQTHLIFKLQHHSHLYKCTCGVSTLK